MFQPPDSDDGRGFSTGLKPASTSNSRLSEVGGASSADAANVPVCLEDSTCGLPVLDASSTPAHTTNVAADVGSPGSDHEVLLETNVTFTLAHYFGDNSDRDRIDEASGSSFFGWRLLPTGSGSSSTSSGSSESSSSSSSGNGLKVGHIDPSGAAAGAGVRVGWLMVQAEGLSVRNGQDWAVALQRAVQAQSPSLKVTFSKQWVMSGAVTPLPASAAADSANNDKPAISKMSSSSSFSIAARLADAADANLEAALLRGGIQQGDASSGSGSSNGDVDGVLHREENDGADPTFSSSSSSSSSRLVVERLARAQEQADQERALKRAREKALQAGLVEDEAGEGSDDGKKRKKTKNKKSKDGSEVTLQLESPLTFASVVVAAQPSLGSWDIVGASQLRHSIAEGLSGQRLDDGWGAHGEEEDEDEAFWQDMARVHGARREALHLLRCLYHRVNPSKLDQVRYSFLFF